MQIQYGTGKYLVQGWHMSLPSVPQLKLRQQNDITKSISPALTDKPLFVESPPSFPLQQKWLQNELCYGYRRAGYRVQPPRSCA